MATYKDKKAFGKELEQRTKNFSVSVIKILQELPKSDETRIIKNQLIRSATSVGANYREANRGRSNADFRNKIRISEGEASESIYWLEIIQDMEWLSSSTLEPVIKENSELIALFSSIVRSLNEKEKSI